MASQSDWRPDALTSSAMRVEDVRVEERLPPVQADRPAERERQLARVALEGEDRHQDHRDVEEEQEEGEVDGETQLRPVTALLDLAPHDDVLRAQAASAADAIVSITAPPAGSRSA